MSKKKETPDRDAMALRIATVWIGERPGCPPEVARKLYSSALCCVDALLDGQREAREGAEQAKKDAEAKGLFDKVT